jgi:hypothetical protein
MCQVGHASAIRILYLIHFVVPDFDQGTDEEMRDSDFRMDESDKESMGASSHFPEDDQWDLNMEQGEENLDQGYSLESTSNGMDVDHPDGVHTQGLQSLDDDMDTDADADATRDAVGANRPEIGLFQPSKIIKPEVSDIVVHKGANVDRIGGPLNGTQSVDDQMDIDGVTYASSRLTSEALEFLYRAYMLRRAPDPTVNKRIIAAEESRLLENVFGSNPADHARVVPQRWFNLLHDVTTAIYTAQVVPPFPEVCSL